MPHDSTSAVHVIVVMGVAGAGKTTVGRALAECLGWSFIEADDYHSAANVARMRRGVALSDDDRMPWLASVRHAIEVVLAHGDRAVVACSALKHAYRIALTPAKAAQTVRFVFLDASEDLARERLAARRGHYAGVALVESQLATLERPREALRLNAAETPVALVAEIRAALRV